MLDYLKITGTPFEVGHELGRYGAHAVHRHLIQTPAWATVMEWRGTERARQMARLAQVRFARYWSELEGMAKGLALSVEEVFLWNCRGDVWAMAPDGCTTVQLPGTTIRRVAHNEDGDPGFSGSCAIAEVSVNGSARFASFVYPGSLPGHTFAVSDSGLAMTVNNLRARHIDEGVPRMMLTRALLDTSDIDAATKLLRESPRAAGFHLTLAHRASSHLLSVEFTSGDCSVRTIENPSMHANHMIHPSMCNRPQIITGSSGYRQITGDALIAGALQSGLSCDPLAILRNQDNNTFPIYRDAIDDSDNENTLATVDIRVQADRIEWEIYTDRTPVPQFQMTDGHQSAFPKTPLRSGHQNHGSANS